MASIVACHELQQTLSEMRTEMCTVFRCVLDDRRSLLGESGEPVSERERIGIGIEESSIGEKCCDPEHELVPGMDTGDSEGTRKGLGGNRIIADMARNLLDDVRRYADISRVPP